MEVAAQQVDAAHHGVDVGVLEAGDSSPPARSTTSVPGARSLEDLRVGADRDDAPDRTATAPGADDPIPADHHVPLTNNVSLLIGSPSRCREPMGVAVARVNGVDYGVYTNATCRDHPRAARRPRVRQHRSERRAR